MIIFLAKWGAKIFGAPLPVKVQAADVDKCPFTEDHVRWQQFMGESTEDRRHIREFLNDINGKVRDVGDDCAEMKAQLNLLLRGARVRWNGDLPRDGK